jgi:hypothetical protein
LQSSEKTAGRCKPSFHGRVKLLKARRIKKMSKKEKHTMNKSLMIGLTAVAIGITAPVFAAGDFWDRLGDRIDRRLDARGERRDDRLDARGDRINQRLDNLADWAEARGRTRLAERLDRRGDRIDNRLDRRGDRIDARLDRRGDRIDRRLDRFRRG